MISMNGDRQRATWAIFIKLYTISKVACLFLSMYHSNSPVCAFQRSSHTTSRSTESTHKPEDIREIIKHQSSDTPQANRAA